jgi:hypothetical protein
VYDIGDVESFNRLTWWRDKFMQNSKGSTKRLPEPGVMMPQTVFVVLGNKCDIEVRQVSIQILPIDQHPLWRVVNTHNLVACPWWRM